MSLFNILIFVSAAALSGLPALRRWRAWLLMIFSALALFWLQPALPIRQMDFWLPLATLAFMVLTWLAARQEAHLGRAAWLSLLALAGIVLAASLLRYFDPLCCITPTRPPDILLVLVGVVVVAALGLALARIAPPGRWPLAALMLLLITVLVILKLGPLTAWASAALRGLVGQSSTQASALDIRWLGISYVAFRLMHVLRDRQLGTLPDLGLHEFAAYVLFFPTLTAGPIDRAERFVKDLRAPFGLSAGALGEGGWRIGLGLFRKFVLADGLALIALNDVNAAQSHSALWTWVLLYAYTLRIYFDFAGYSDIAIGIGRLAGFTIPENFNRPYLKPNLTAFWDSWHMTLAQWFRGYYFNPLSRALLRSRSIKVSMGAMIGFCQITTMILIGLWHGISLNFVIWGAWHGVGLFIHNRWASLTLAQTRALAAHPWRKRLIDAATTLLTFQFVVMGWLWFALRDTDMAWRVFLRLFGM